MQIEIPQLAAGEHYAGLVLAPDGTPTHQLVLLPGDADDQPWEQAKTWCTERGGDLPTEQELALLYANCREQFRRAWYWSSQQHESDPDYVWCQNFDDGFQGSLHRSSKLRARAVRRLIIQ